MIRTIDFYVEVIDNFGDLGFALNLAFIMLKNDLSLKIRLFSNDKNLFENMLKKEKKLNIDYLDLKDITNHKPSLIIFNFFDRKIDYQYLNKFDYEIKLINFSYFLMHDGVSSLHNTTYQNKNISVTHFVPSLLQNTGGVLINNIFDYKDKNDFLSYLNKKYNLNIDLNLDNFVSVFVYKDTLEDIFKNIKNDTNTYFIFGYSDLKIDFKNIIIMPFFDLQDYNNFLRVCDVNIVRGENSLVSSLLAGKPTLWDIYKEDNGAHIYKIEDFINFLRDYNFLDDYFDLFKEFNGQEKYKSFDVFIKNKLLYKENFYNIGYYVNSECNAYEKIKKILN